MSKFYLQDIRRLLSSVGVLIFGLLIAQVIGTLLVYRSNLVLLDKLVLIREAGFGPLPGMGVVPPLSSLSAALAGGLFFTLSVGAGVVLLTMGVFGFVGALPSKWKKHAVVVPGTIWPALLIWANARGFSPGLNAFLLLVPVPVWWACRKWWPPFAEVGRLPWSRVFHFSLIAVLLVLWVSRLNNDVFLNIKDNLLLTSKPGKKFVHLYYQYTLYPAEAFKTLSQKQVISCRLEGFVDDGLEKKVAEALATNDFFVVSPGKTDLTVTVVDDQLLFGCRGDPVLSVTAAGFLTAPGEFLGRVSEECDINASFRRVTMISLLGLAPLVPYLASLVFFGLVPGMFVNRRVSSWLVPGLCFFCWSGILFYLDTPPLETADRQAAAVAIESGSRREKLAALRYIYEHKLDITRFDGYRELLDSDDFSQQYWLVKNLGNSRYPGAWNHIFHYFESDSPYLVCKAIGAAAMKSQISGKAGERRLKKELVGKLSASDNWYVQMYAYKSARRLGWTPEK